MNYDKFIRKTLFDFLDENISINEYLALQPTNTPDLTDEIVNKFTEAYIEKKSGIVDLLLIAAVHSGPSKKYSSILEKLLEADWVYNQENMISFLGDIKDPSTAGVLYRMIDKPVPGSFYGSHKVKCVWALANIDSEIAIIYLKTLTKSCDNMVRFNAEEILKEKKISY
ncbi:hypothetical protein BH09BAC5_BH09BAC5_08860 [soil metagenome]